MTDFSGDMKEDLQAIASYLDWLQNHFGPTKECGCYDYTSETRDDFDAYVGCHFDPENLNTTIQLLRHQRTVEHS